MSSVLNDDGVGGKHLVAAALQEKTLLHFPLTFMDFIVQCVMGSFHCKLFTSFVIYLHKLCNSYYLLLEFQPQHLTQN